MANSDINMERFAHDVCVHVLEKFGIFKAPDDTRKQNKYANYDFLPCVSRSVVSCAIWIRDSFKNELEDKYKNSDSSDKEIPWNFFDDYLLKNDKYVESDCTGKVCISLALCTEYIQFVNRKNLIISLNKIAIRWTDFFEKNLRGNFESEGGFLKLYSNLKNCQAAQIDNFHKAFISEYCRPYGAKQCTMELAKKCAEKHGVSLDFAIFGIATSRSEESQNNPVGTDEPKISDSKDCSSSTDSHEKTDSEMSPNMESAASESETSENNLLGIPPHEEMLREIDPFFVENIPSPPKRHLSSKLAELEVDSCDDPLSPSKSTESEFSSCDDPLSPSKSTEGEVVSCDAALSPSKSTEREAGSCDVPLLPFKLTEREVCSCDVPLSPSKSTQREVGSYDVPLSPSKSTEREVGSYDVTLSPSKSTEREVVSCDAPLSPSKSTEPDSGSSEILRSSLKQKELQDIMEQVISNLELDMETLKALLFEHGLLKKKSGRRGSGMRIKDAKEKISHQDPEGLI